jgi:hypothetical protein
MTLVADTHVHDVHNDNFDAVRESMQIGFDQALTNGPLFKTDAEDLFDLYLDSLPVHDAAERQYYNCGTCKDFVRTYGGLVTVDNNGDLVPVMWQMTDCGFYQPAIDALRNRISKAKISSAFFPKIPPYQTGLKVWGEPQTGEWTHYAVAVSTRLPNFFTGKSGSEAMAEAMAHSKERRRMVASSFADIKAPVLDEALRVLKSDTLERSDRFIAPLQWLRDLHDRPKGPRGDNLLWKAVTLAPEGYCHPRSAVTNTLLDDIEKGLPFADISRKWAAKMHPLQFQRPQAAPSAQTIVQAEKLIENLGVARSLERRYARLEEVRTIWKPEVVEEKQKPTGIFAHLQAKDQISTSFQVTLPTKTVTWDKFVEKVLPTAKQLQIRVPSYGNFSGVLTAEHADAPPILKWDAEDNRYPISSYVYNGGSRAHTWGLTVNDWVDVTGIMPVPSVPGEEGNALILMVKGAKDSRSDQGNALFPEIMKSEFHGIRSVVEAYSKTAQIGGRDEASANGLGLNKGSANYFLKVHDGTGWMQYQIDRWE